MRRMPLALGCLTALAGMRLSAAARAQAGRMRGARERQEHCARRRSADPPEAPAHRALLRCVLPKFSSGNPYGSRGKRRANYGFDRLEIPQGAAFARWMLSD